MNVWLVTILSDVGESYLKSDQHSYLTDERKMTSSKENAKRKRNARMAAFSNMHLDCARRLPHLFTAEAVTPFIFSLICHVAGFCEANLRHDVVSPDLFYDN